MKNVLHQLISQTPKDKNRKTCKQCHELGHGITSVHCKINIEKNLNLKQKIKRYMLSKNCLDGKSFEEHCEELSIMLCITPNLCKTLYNDIPFDELLDRPMNIEQYLTNLKVNSCYECKKDLICVQQNTHRIWKGNLVCDSCWCRYAEHRKILWEQVKTYKPNICGICSREKLHNEERFHYDHINMFKKDTNICGMVNEGLNIEDIYTEIDKCQLLCLECHHIVTDIEHQLSFTRIKQSLTRSLNQGDLTQSMYEIQRLYYQDIYEKKMKSVYKLLKISFYH